ncbi:MAG TPA: hypothetical protein VFC46_00425, partial [Humisphaera sp.]|nr:hypothetical protein [Humisphaera sp.]
SATTASRRARATASTVTAIPWRIPQTRTPGELRESAIGVFYQIISTSNDPLEPINIGCPRVAHKLMKADQS